MKRLLQTATLAVVLGATLLAQRGFGPRDAGGTPPDPAARIANQVARLTTLLDLTTAQASQITTILTSEDSAASSARTTLDTDRTALQAAIKSNGGSSIDQLAAAIGVLEGQLLAAQSKAAAAIYVLLTPAQQAKLDTMGGLGMLGGGPGGRGPGGPGGPGGPRGPRP